VDLDFELRGAAIGLDALLKATGLAASGGAAKIAIVGGTVRVNGEPELRRSRKLRAGDEVVFEGSRVRICASLAADPAAPRFR
jgi:ribosome-associated protein